MTGILEITSKKHTLYIFQEDHSFAFIRFIYSYWEEGRRSHNSDVEVRGQL